MNQAQIVHFCRLLREYVMEHREEMARYNFDMAIGFRACYGLQDYYDPDMYMRMVDLTDAAITARYGTEPAQ